MLKKSKKILGGVLASALLMLTAAIPANASDGSVIVFDFKSVSVTENNAANIENPEQYMQSYGYLGDSSFSQANGTLQSTVLPHKWEPGSADAEFGTSIELNKIVKARKYVLRL